MCLGLAGKISASCPPRAKHSPRRTLIKCRVPLGLMAAETCLTLGLDVLLVLYFFLVFKPCKEP